MATCEKGHVEIIYDDVLGLIGYPLCEALTVLETTQEMLEEAEAALERNAGPMTPKQPLPCVPM